MTNNTQMTNINELFMQFLNEHGSEDMVQEWQKPKYQEKLMELLPKKTKVSGKKDPNKPKRGKSAYLFFCGDHRASVKEELGDEAKATEVTAELGRQWNELKESTKAADKKKIAKYEEQAKKDKERYLTEMAEYEPPSDGELGEAVVEKKPKKVTKEEKEEEVEEEVIEEDEEDENLKKLIQTKLKPKSEKKSEKKRSKKKL